MTNDERKLVAKIAFAVAVAAPLGGAAIGATSLFDADHTNRNPQIEKAELAVQAAKP